MVALNYTEQYYQTVLYIDVYPALTGSKTPTSKFGCKAKELGGRSTARKSPIGEG
ncbi:hypothetical protein IIM_00049 [Bacillus cereus VD107]|nr:hypothetical protein IIM_00049 [Bacillus cereus VD107]